MLIYIFYAIALMVDIGLLYLASVHLRETWEWMSTKDLMPLAILILGLIANASLLTYFMYFYYA